MAERIVIHRDRTFEYRGETWKIIGGGPGTPNAEFGYELWNDARQEAIDGFFTYADIRRYLADAVANDWSLLEDDEGTERMNMTPKSYPEEG